MVNGVTAQLSMKRPFMGVWKAQPWKIMKTVGSEVPVFIKGKTKQNSLVSGLKPTKTEARVGGARGPWGPGVLRCRAGWRGQQVGGWASTAASARLSMDGGASPGTWRLEARQRPGREGLSGRRVGLCLSEEDPACCRGRARVAASVRAQGECVSAGTLGWGEHTLPRGAACSHALPPLFAFFLRTSCSLTGVFLHIPATWPRAIPAPTRSESRN